MKRRASVIFINSLSSYARMGIGMVLSLLITRSALHVLAENSPTAKEVFGIFMLLTSITTGIQFLNDSTQQAMVRFLAISLDSGDRLQTKQLFNSGWVMSTAIGSTIAILMAVLAPWLVASFNVPEGLVTPAKYVVWLSALAQIISAMSQPWYAVLSAEDRYALVNFLGVLQQVLVLSGLSLIPLLPINLLVGLSLVWLTPGLVIGVFLAGWMMLQKPFARLDWRSVRWLECKQLFSLGGWQSLISFASSLYERTDQILINLLLGPAFNTLYAVVIQLGNSINRLVTAITGVLLPTASRIIGNGSPWEKQQLIIRSTRYVLVLAMPSAVGICIFRREIIEMWLGKGFEQAIAILPFTMFLVFSRIPIFVTWPYLTAANQLKLPSLAMLFDGIVNVVLSVWYVKAFNLGLAGIVLGTLSTNLIRFTLFQIPFVARLVELPVSQYWLKGYGRPIIPMLWFVPTIWFLQSLGLQRPTTISLLIIVAVVYAISVWFWVFDEYEHKLFTGMFNQILRKKKAQNN
jgi:O-antigen/teichoic acid export membrane protein